MNQWTDAGAIASKERERSFLRSVYGWMFGGLLLSAVSAFWVVSSPIARQLIFGNRVVPILLMVATLGLVFFLSMRIQKMSPGVAAGSFFLFAVLNGLALSSILLMYTASSVAQTFVIAGGMFGAMSVYGFVTRRDLTSWGSFFFMGLIGILIAMVVNFFFHSSALSGAISILGVFIFLGLTAWDTQRLKKMAHAGGGTNLAVIGALSLYLDFINLFLFLLRLLGDRR
ncbi:MAG: Bax inhibitor-1/YccA family protein [Thermoanaerobaculia bacterium]